jgi:UDP-4-amino-4-deoxy-L-arabinose formyltransferase/UDP-glucuronic acid dehydrogenase (UDP-4-keto-hexauronic acid decarboxylating)
MNKKIIFMGGKQIGANCLKTLISKGINPTCVIPNRSDKGIDISWHESLLKIANKHNLLSLENSKVSDPLIIQKIQEINPEIIFCIGSTQLIPESILKSTRLGCLNIHPAYLPKYRGRYSTAHAIANGETETGVTLHWMDTGIDTGPIIIQKKISIEESDTAKTLYDKFTSVGTKLFETFLEKWLSGEKIEAFKQDENLATYYPKSLPNNDQIDWNWSGTQIKNFIRAMTFEPFDPPYFYIGEKKMVIVEEKYFKGFNNE